MNKKLNAVLINPPTSGSYRSKIMLGDSLALSSVAQTMLSQGWSVSIVDCFLRNWDVQMLIDNLPENFELVAITIMSSMSIEIVRIIIKKIREINPTVHITVGGSAPTLEPKRFYDLDINSLMVGDDVKQINQLLEDYEKYRLNDNIFFDKKIYLSKTYLTYSYEKIYRPDISLAFEQDRIISLESSKGCYGNCSFCSINFAHSSMWIPRDVENVFKEIDYIKSTLPDCSQVRFVDANFLGGREDYLKRYILISKYLKNQDIKFRLECRVDDINYDLFKLLKENGLSGVFIGIENGQQHILDSLSKNISINDVISSVKILRELKISYSFGFMMVTPLTTKKDIIANISFLKIIKYGIRWKHLFSALIIQKNNCENEKHILKSDCERKLGYVIKDALCLKLLNFYDVSLKEYLPVLELEHIIGIAIERGKESEDEWFWQIDEIFSKMCIDVFNLLIFELDYIEDNEIQMRRLVDQYMEILENKMKYILEKIKTHGLAESVMLKSIKDYIW